MKEYSSPEQENRRFVNALREVCRLAGDQSWKLAVVVRASKKGEGNLDIRSYDVVNQRLSSTEETVSTDDVPRVLKGKTSEGQPVLQVIKNKDGTHTVRHVDAELTRNLTRMPDGVMEALEVNY
ncbi:MAG: hypothetical protein Q7S01_04305 [bacterium]|nr:hypothetical protein [bacterium]